MRKPTLAELTAERLSQIEALFSSGVTEDTGRLRRRDGYGADAGEILGRFGGVKPAFPELRGLAEGPGRIAAAIRQGRGALYARVADAVTRDVERTYEPPKRRSSGRPSIAPHAGFVHCHHCQALHTKGQHRFHGPGSFHRTHLFSFNFMTAARAKRLFADLMGIARRRSLKPAEKDLLVQARQYLRRAARPAMNPKKSRRLGGIAARNLSRAAAPHTKSSAGGIVKLGRCLEIRYQRTMGRKPGLYKHVFTKHVSVYTMPDGSTVIR